jgi:hypothetical protein
MANGFDANWVRHTAFILLAATLLQVSTAGQTVAIDPTRLLEHIKMLASDEFEGRLPGTVGEDKSVAYITEQFKSIGLEPGNPNGSYLQEVPLVGSSSTLRSQPPNTGIQ